LVINRFRGNGIVLLSGGTNVIEGNLIGVSLSGSADLGNSANGILVSNSVNNVIGGTSATSRNVISGNNQNGILILGTNGSGNSLLGNYIGLAVDGLMDLGNTANGVFINAGRSNAIGSGTAGAGNLISGNGASGVRLGCGRAPALRLASHAIPTSTARMATPATEAAARAAVAGAAFLAAVPLLGVVLAWPLRPPPDNSGRTATVALVQGDVPDAGLEFNARRRQVLDNHVTQTLQLADRVKSGAVPRPDLVLWPEHSSDIDPFHNPDAAAQITKAVDAKAAAALPVHRASRRCRPHAVSARFRSERLPCRARHERPVEPGR
jgi:hypothetical protein